MQLYKALFRTLNEHSVRYLVAGGVAVNLYGIPRATADIDLAVQLDAENVDRFIAAMKKLGLLPKVPAALQEFADPDVRRQWATEKNMVVFSLYDPRSPFLVVDVFIREPFDFDRAYENRTRLDLDAIEIPVVPLEDLVRMKEGSGRPQDIADIHYLKKIIEGRLDD